MKQKDPVKKRLVQVPGIVPKTWIEVPINITEEELQVKFKRITDSQKKEWDNLKSKIKYRDIDLDQKYTAKGYSGTIYNLREIISNYK